MNWFGRKKKNNVTADWENSMEVHSHGIAPVVISFDKEAEKEYEAAWAATVEEMKNAKGEFRKSALDAYNRELAEADGCVGCCVSEAVIDSMKDVSGSQSVHSSVCDEDGAPPLLQDPNHSNRARARSNSSTASAVSIEDARGMSSIRDGKDKDNSEVDDSEKRAWFDMEDDERASRFYTKAALISCLCVLIAAFIILLVALLNKNNPTDGSELNLGNNTLISDGADQSDGKEECEGMPDYLIYTSCDSFSESESPQRRAWEWLVNSDEAGLSLESGSSEFEMQQRFAAATLYFSSGGSKWLSGLGFLSGGSICTWNDGQKGIFCSDSGTDAVTEINVVDNNLVGTIPVELNHFSQMKSLNLYFGKLTGSIPNLAALEELEQIDFDGNELSGDVPESIFNLPKLKNLFLLNNKGLTGRVPEIREDSQLENLSLYECSLSGPIPASLGAVSTLQLLQFKGNALTGTIPTSLFALPELHTFDLHGNRLQGTIPSFQTGSGGKLETLSLGGNLLDGPLPTGVEGLTVLKYFYAHGNQLTGGVSDEIMSLPAMEQLWLHGNQFSAELPDVSLLPATIKDLFLDNNDFSGSLDDLLSTAPTSLERIDISANSRLGGFVSNDIGRFTSLVAFNASYCDLSGGLRGDSLSQLSLLQSFAVAGNFMSDEIPSRIESMTNLEILDLSKNDFSGSIPVELGNLEYLSYLDLSGNADLTGDLDSIICNKEFPLSSAIADCSGGEPVQCSCCTCF